MADNVAGDTSSIDGINQSVIMDASIDGLPDFMLQDQTWNQVLLTESLLSPMLQTQIQLDDVIMTSPMKNYDLYKGKNFVLSASNPNLPGIQLDVNNVIYRLEKRRLVNRNSEKYLLQATDKSLLQNQAVRITRQWYKVTPSSIVSDALGVAQGSVSDVESTTPIRDYSASNIHPFEVINAQADYALADGNDPSLLHYMTYENGGTHKFRSIKFLTSQPIVATYDYQDQVGGSKLARSFGIIAHEFPCEFDLLSDIMNGVVAQSAASILVNTVTRSLNALNSTLGGVLGGALSGSVFSNKGSEDHSATTAYENPQQFRAARLALLKPDRISLRMTVPFNPSLHAGNMIHAEFPSMLPDVPFEFGTGDYMIVSLTHNLNLGGYGITVLDCVARSVGDGVVS